MRNHTPTSVYLISNRDGVVIYVGISAQVHTRMAQHARTAPWASDAHMVQVTEYATRTMAMAVEQLMIQRYRATVHNDAYVATLTEGKGAHIARNLEWRFGSVDAVQARYGRPAIDRVFLSAHPR